MLKGMGEVKSQFVIPIQMLEYTSRDIIFLKRCYEKKSCL